MADFTNTEIADFENQIHELVLNDFEKFCQMAGVNKKQLAVCLEFKKDKSYGEIAIKLKIPKGTVYAIAQKCPEN